MDIFTRNDLEILMKEKERLCVSLFMPTQKAGRGTQQNHIRFKNILREAQEFLSQKGVGAQQIHDMLAPAYQFVQNPLFWQFQSDGLAVYLSPRLFRYYRLPLQFEKLVIVNDRFHVKPLLPLFIASGKFYVLCLSKNNTRVIQCSAMGASEVFVATLPRSLRHALRYEEYEPHGRVAMSPRNKLYQGSPVYHGGSSEADYEKDELSRYFRMIDRGIHELMMRERVPLVLAGVEYFIPLYREATTYHAIVDGSITGATDRMNTEELYEKAKAIVQPYFAKKQEQAFARYLNANGSAPRLTSNDIRETVVNAHLGRVDTLFASSGGQVWGSFNTSSREVIVHEKEEPGDGDLVDLAMSYTLLHNGSVYLLGPGMLRPKERLAALLRY